MPHELIRPVDPDSAHAIEETAKTAAKAIDAAVQAGKYAGEVLGDLPHDLVGIMGDWIKHKRARRWAELSADYSLGNSSRPSSRVAQAQPAPEVVSQPTFLLEAPEGNELSRDRLGSAGNHRPDISGEEKETAKKERPPAHLID